MRRAAGGLVLAAVLLAGAPADPARAAGGDPGANVDTAMALLPGGARLGTVRDRADATRAGGDAGTAPCTSAAHPDGYRHAAVYEITPSAYSALEMSVADDLNGSPSLCAVSVYARRSGALTMTDAYDAAQRTAHLLAESTGCAAAAACGVSRELAASQTYYVVLWSAAPASEQPADAAFSLTAQVRVPVAAGLAVRGHRIVERGWFEVIAGRGFLVIAGIPGATGSVRFREHRLGTDGAYHFIRSTTRALSGGRAAWSIRAPSRGKHRYRADYLGDDFRLPDESPVRPVKFAKVRWRRYSEGGAMLYAPRYRQQYRLSCEESSLRSALAFHGIYRSDYQILKVVGYRPRVRGATWDDPDEQYVGYVNGSMGTTGYGVHWRPIARAATRYRPDRPAVILRGFTRQRLAGNVDLGFPVVIWGAHEGSSGRILPMRWRTRDGDAVRAYSVEHTWLVVGFRGRRTSPTHFIVINPSNGNRSTLSWAAVSRFARYFGYSGVVVR